MRRELIVTVVLAAVVLAGFFMLSWSPSETVDAQEATIETAQVERRTLGQSVETTGTIAPEETIYLTFNTSGAVSEVAVEVGDTVNVGDVLARLDTADLEYQIRLQEQALIVQQTSYDELVAPPTEEELAQARSNLASAQSQLTSAQVALETAPNETTISCADLTTLQSQLGEAEDDYAAYVKDGYEMDANFMPDPDSEAGEALQDAQSAFNVAQAQCNNVTDESEYELQVASAQASVDQAQAALDDLMAGATAEDIAAAEAQLEQARLELENARASLEDAVITAPFGGVISEVNITVGEYVNSSSSALTLVDTSTLHVDVSVDELDIAQVETGQSAIIAPDALDNTTLQGIVARIAPTGVETDGVVTYDVRVDLVDFESVPVRMGMTTDVEIAIGSSTNALVVPTDAIQRDGQVEFVEVLENDTPVRVDITTGQTADGYTEITGDVAEGSLVVIPVLEPATSGAGGPFGG